MYHAELNMAEARRRVVLSVLGDIEPGDVFYLVSNPEGVWMREEDPEFSSDSYDFGAIGNETWYQLADIGTGDPKQRVIVIHNTRKHTAKEST